MVNDVYGPPDPVGEAVRREAGQWWWLALVTGIAWTVIGWAVLRADVVSLTTVGVLVGFVFLGIAITESLQVWLFRGGWRMLHILLAAVNELALTIPGAPDQAAAISAAEAALDEFLRRLLTPPSA